MCVFCLFSVVVAVVVVVVIVSVAVVYSDTHSNMRAGTWWKNVHPVDFWKQDYFCLPLDETHIDTGAYLTKRFQPVHQQEELVEAMLLQSV